MENIDQAKYHTLFNEASDGLLIMTDRGELTDVNNSMCEYLGYTRAEMLKMNVEDLLEPEQLKKTPVAYDKIVQNNQFTRERRLKRKDGTIIEMEANVQRIEPDFNLAICRELSQIRLINKQLALSESKFRSAFEYSPLGMMLVSPLGQIFQVNSRVCEMLGFSENELLKKNLKDISHPDDQNIAGSFIRKNYKDQKTTLQTEKRYIHKNKSTVWVNLSVSAITDEDGQLEYLSGQLEDITEKKESELKFENLLEKSLVGVYINQDKYFQYTNPKMSEIFGYTKEELLEMPSNKIFHPEDLPLANEMMRRRMDGEIDAVRYEARGMKKDGTIIWLEIYGSSIIHKGKIAVIGNMLDVTERKLYERELKRINFENIERVKELNCLYQVSELAKNDELSNNEIISLVVDIIPPSYQYPDITRARISFENHVHESKNFVESPWSQKAEIKINKETIGFVEVFYTEKMAESYEGPFLQEERSLLDSLAVVLGDTVDRRKSASRVKEQAKTFQAIIENTKESIYLISPDFKLLQFNKIASDRMLMQNGIEIKIGQDFNDLFNPSTKDFFQSLCEDSLKGNYRNEEVRTKGKFGDYYWASVKTSPVYTQDNELLGVSLLVEVIDDRKKAEIRLKESEEKFRSIVEQSLVGVYIIQDDKLQYVNPGFEKIFGYTKEELLKDASFEDLIFKDDIEMVKSSYQSRIHENKTSNQYTFRGLHKDGSIIYLEIIASSIMYNNRLAAIGALVDITDRIKDEIRINEAVIDAQEKERYQIGMELHDNVQQILVGSGMFLDVAIKGIEDKKALTEVLLKLKTYNADAVNELRHLSHQLAPSVDSEFSLLGKIESLLSSFQVSKEKEIFTNIYEFEPPLSSEIQLAFYRILQEQLTNIQKYANASKIEIEIRPFNNLVQLIVRDNGVGFDTNEKMDGIGLENIRRRAQFLSGKVKISSAPNKGCALMVEVPLPKEHHQLV